MASCRPGCTASTGPGASAWASTTAAGAAEEGRLEEGGGAAGRPGPALLAPARLLLARLGRGGRHLGRSPRVGAGRVGDGPGPGRPVRRGGGPRAGRGRGPARGGGCGRHAGAPPRQPPAPPLLGQPGRIHHRGGRHGGFRAGRGAPRARGPGRGGQDVLRLVSPPFFAAAAVPPSGRRARARLVFYPALTRLTATPLRFPF